MSKPSRAEFLENVAGLVGTRFPLVKLEKSEGDFSLRINGHWISLENLYRISADDAEHLPRHVERWVVELLRAAEGSPDEKASFDELQQRIFPVMLSGTRGGGVGAAMVRQQLVSGLDVGYAVDAERTISYIPKRLFGKWNISVDDLHAAALQNLVARSEVLQAHAAPDESGQVMLILIQTMDGYDASRILLPGLHDHLREYLGSPFLAGIPNRDILICFRDEPENVDRLTKRIREDYRTMPHQVTDQVFLVTPDGIAPYAPPDK